MRIPNSHEIIKLFDAYDISFAYLFGSRSRGSATQKSDYDFAVYLPFSSKTQRFAVRLKLIQKLSQLFRPLPVDVIVLNDTHSVTLRYNVIAEGQLIYEKDEEKRFDFELFTMREYEDFSPFLNAYNQEYSVV